MAFRFGGLFFDGNRLAGRIELDNTVAFRIIHMIAEDRRSRGELFEGGTKTAASVEDVVAKDQGDRVTADEGFGDEKGLCDAVWFRLLAIFDGDAHARAVTKELFEARKVMGC